VAYSRQGTDKRGQTRFALASGGEADCRSDSFGAPPGFYLLMEIVESRALGQAAGPPRVQSLLAVQPDWLLEALPQRVKEVALVTFDPGAKRVQARERLTYGALVLDEGEARTQMAREAAAEVLVKEARKAGLKVLCGEGQPDRYLARRAFILQSRPDVELPDEEAVWAVVTELAQGGALSFEALAHADPLRIALERAPQARRLLEELAPPRLRLPSGRETAVHYPPGQPAWVASRMQDFFGMKETPKAAGHPLTVHLLAPNQRPQQVTQDLAGFWQREYPRLRKELMRKYPRHAWPEDPCA
jgi:ATP-dependent helicase HrpB